MRIHDEATGLFVNAFTSNHENENVDGHEFMVGAGEHTFYLHFQKGNPSQVGMNGLTNEAMLKILQYRITKQNSILACSENEEVLSCIEKALAALDARSKRMSAQSSGPSTSALNAY